MWSHSAWGGVPLQRRRGHRNNVKHTIMGIQNYAKTFILVLRAATLYLTAVVVQGESFATKSGSIETIDNGLVGQDIK